MLDKQAVLNRVQILWPNEEEKLYLLGLLAQDMGSNPSAQPTGSAGDPNQGKSTVVSSPGVITEAEAKEALDK